jgi:hypothetical protein
MNQTDLIAYQLTSEASNQILKKHSKLIMEIIEKIK